MFQVEGVDYTPEGIEAVRHELIQMRDQAMEHWPDGIAESVLLSHAIALLAAFKEERTSQCRGTAGY